MNRHSSRHRLILLVAALSLATGLPAASAEPGAVSPARYSNAAAASEYWDFTARFESQHRVFARFLITNEGPGLHSAVAFGHLVFPDGRVVHFKNGRREGRWELSDDRLRIRIGSSVLDQHGPLPKLEVDNDKRGIKLHLFFDPDGAAPDAPASGSDSGRGFELLDSDAPVQGTVWVEDMAAPLDVRGTLAITHAWMDETESELTLRRIEFFSLADDLSIYLTDITAPRGPASRWLVVEQAGEVIHSSDDFELTLDQRSGKRGDYPIPTTLRFSSGDIEGEVQLTSVVLEHDPLEVLPQPFRFLLSLKSSPHRVWADSPFEVRLRAGADSPLLHYRGSGITNVTFLNPVPEPSGA